MADERHVIDFSVFEQVEVRVGVITSIEIAEGCRVAAYRLSVDLGPQIGVKQSVAQATNYSPEQLYGKQVLAVINLKPRQVGKHMSEVLVLGVPTENKGTALVVPDMEAVLGSRLF